MKNSLVFKKISSLTVLIFLVASFQNCQNSEFQLIESELDLNQSAIDDIIDVVKTKRIHNFEYSHNIKIDGNYSYHMKAHDINQDGFEDLILAETTRQKLGIALNDGTGKLSLERSLETIGSTTSRILIEDFNKDGHFDIATATSSGYLHLWVNEGSNQFSNRTDYQDANAATTTDFIQSGDFNGDGYKDIAVALTNSNVTGHIRIYINDQSGGFTASTETLAAGLRPHGLTAGDINKDGLSDLIFTSRQDDKVYILQNNSGSFSEAASFVGAVDPNDSELSDILVADLNKDGHLDLAWGSMCTLGKLECHKSVYEQNIYVNYGDGSFNYGNNIVAHANQAYGEVRILEAYDINQDGYLDLASIDDINTWPFSAQGEYSSISIFLNDKKSGFKKVKNKMLSRVVDKKTGDVLDPGSSYSNSFAFADFNKDGLVDFAADAKVNGSKLSSGTRVYIGLFHTVLK